MTTLTTKTDGAIKINGTPYQTGRLDPYYNTERTRLFVRYDNGQLLVPGVLYSDITVDGVPMASPEAMDEFVVANFFFEAPGSGGGGGATEFRGRMLFEGDGVTTTLSIVHGLNIADPEPIFSITSSRPIPLNSLNRTITFPDPNTMLITFDNAPLEGENADYVIIVYK